MMNISDMHPFEREIEIMENQPQIETKNDRNKKREATTAAVIASSTNRIEGDFKSKKKNKSEWIEEAQWNAE